MEKNVFMCLKQVSVHTNETDISYGADIGWLSQLEDQGVTYVDDNGIEADALELLKDKGVNAFFIKKTEFIHNIVLKMRKKMLPHLRSAYLLMRQPRVMFGKEVRIKGLL